MYAQAHVCAGAHESQRNGTLLELVTVRVYPVCVPEANPLQKQYAVHRALSRQLLINDNLPLFLS